MQHQTEHELLDELAKHLGINPDYYDIFGRQHVVSDDTKRAIVAAMGHQAATSEQLRAALAALHDAAWRQPCDSVVVQRVGADGRWSFRMPAESSEEETIRIVWTVRDEAGHDLVAGQAGPGLRAVGSQEIQGQQYRKFHLPVPTGLDIGYYQVTANGTSPSRRVMASLRLIIVPDHCYQPGRFQAGGRVWGLSLQLYALRSAENWGAGDFSDLLEWTDWAAKDLGAGIIGLNPVHALKNSRPYHISPYSPDSRLHLNALYIDVEDVPEFEESTEARAAVTDEDFLSRLASLRKSDTVEYERIAAEKRRVLELLFTTFEERHFIREADRLMPCTQRSEVFERYLEQEGSALETYALFQVLAETFSRQSPPLRVWQEWPDCYRHPSSPAAREFLAVHRREVRFHQYVQWLAHQQLRRVHEHTRKLGMPIGLYHDLALGSDRGGADAWLFQSALALGADAGCPPDAFGPDGQNWGLPPVNPHALRQSGYQMFIDLLRKNLQYGGAIRLDHVMTLFRLFWIPRGLPPSAGAYVDYPWEDLLGILSLESVRHRTVIVGEDLGTVPDFVRDKLGMAGVLSYRVFYFERYHDGEWKQPNVYPRQALAVATTHDLPTLAGFWSGEDMAVRERLGLYRDESARRGAGAERERDKAGIARALQREGVWPIGLTEAAALHQPLSPELIGAIHAYVARSPSSFMLVTLEDLLGDVTQINLPGTLDSYPNWSRKMPLTLAEVKRDRHATQLAMTLRTIRP